MPRSEGGEVSDFIVGVALSGLLAGLSVLACVCLLTAAEIAFPREDHMNLGRRARAFGFAMITVVCAIAVGRLVRFPTPSEALIPSPSIGSAVVAILLSDFIYYWYHRAQHAIPFLWRIHAVHHSPEKLGAGSGYHHVLEVPLKAFLVGAPTALLFGGRAGTIAAALVSLHGFYVHSTTRLNFGRFSKWICDNRIHRIHHSRERRHYDKNFGVVTLVWDRLFGTAYLPARSEWPDVGLDERREPRSIREWLSLSGKDPNRPACDIPAAAVVNANGVDV